MTFIADSRKPGAGIWPLQHKGYDENSPKFDLDMRSSILSVRVIDRRDDKEGLGAWVYDEETVGDVNGAQVWLPSGKDGKRECAMWRFATPVVTVKKGDDVATGGARSSVATGDTSARSSGATPAQKKSSCGFLPDFRILPIKDKEYSEDDRLEKVEPTRPKRNNEEAWPKFPIDFFGISLPADKENEQQDLFMPTDTRIVSPNVAGDPTMGSWICDLDSEFKIDLKRTAPMQTFARVIKDPFGCISFVNRNSIAWNIGFSGCQDVRGGLVIDFPGGGANGGGGGAVHGSGDGSGRPPPWFPPYAPPSKKKPPRKRTTYHPKFGFVIPPDPVDLNKPRGVPLGNTPWPRGVVAGGGWTGGSS